MPNGLTRVPESPPPPLDDFTRIVRVADLAMKLFYSTPKSGTLRTTWVTPATLWFSYLAAVGCIVIAFLCASQYLIALALWEVLLAIVICGVLALSCSAIACTGTLQRIYSGNHPM
jgi:hypothetical protein